MMGVASAAASLGCGSEGTSSPTTTEGTTGTTGGSALCAVSPTETIGPYPSLTNFVRSDIREGKTGTPLTLTITVVNANNSCSPVANAAVKVTQIAFPESVIDAVYASGVYASKGRNPTSNSGDMVFADSLSSELATLTGGDPTTGYTATFTVGISI
jgi:hypothetical protein